MKIFKTTYFLITLAAFVACFLPLINLNGLLGPKEYFILIAFVLSIISVIMGGILRLLDIEIPNYYWWICGLTAFIWFLQL
jgi:hypothetical protein